LLHLLRGSTTGVSYTVFVTKERLGGLHDVIGRDVEQGLACGDAGVVRWMWGECGERGVGNASLACAESFEDATKVGQLGITLGQLLTFGFQIRLAKWHCHSTPQLIIRPEPERHTDSRSTLFLLFNPTVHYFTPPTAHHRPHTTDRTPLTV